MLPFPAQSVWLCAAVPLALGVACLPAVAGPRQGRRVEDFGRDPCWEGHRNRLLPRRPPSVRQDFGHRATRRAGGREAGEVGGWVQRSVTPASYAKPLRTRTLGDWLTASGRFAVTRCDA